MKEPGVFEISLKRNIAVMLLFCIFGCPSAFLASDSKQENTEAKVDYASVQQEIVRFETVVNEALNTIFSSSPFAVVQKAKGAYLEGYGISFAFLVNIHRAVINTPFGQVRSRTAITPDLKKMRIEELKEKLIRLIQDNGDNFRQLPKNDYVTVVAYVEDRNFPDEPSANKTIVMSALKKDLDELGNKNGSLREFKQRMKIVEY